MTVNAAVSAPTQRLSHLRQALLSAFWFGLQAHWAAILLITLPQQAFMIGGDAAKGQTLGIVLLLGAFVSMVVAPLFGALSDRFVTRFGRRRPWMVVGTLMNVLGLYGLAYLPRANDLSSLPLFIGAFMWVELWNNAANAPFNALIPDLVPKDQRGSASGWFGLMNILGSFTGAVTGLVFTQNGVTDVVTIYQFIAVVLIVSMIVTVVSVKEPKVTVKLPPFKLREFVAGLAEPMRDHDFRWVFWTRFLWVMGTFTVQEFLLFYMRDVVKTFTLFGNPGAQNAESAVSFFSAALLFGAIAPSIIAGILSDRFGRKKMVYIASGLQALVPIVLIFTDSFEAAVIMGLIFGIGYGAYQAVDWAMASDVLPSEADYAKDMGVWHIAWTFPQVIATPIAGVLLDKFQVIGAQSGQANLGYTVIFVLAAFYLLLGTVLVRKVRKVR
ncbi:MAG: MFS transporter [Chloroflexi bacterium]|nr:MFS transporter [Chloroflexota bacterium]